MPKSTPSRSQPPDYLMLGKVLRPHGVRGELRVSAMTDYPERVKDLKQVYIGRDTDDKRAKPYSIKSVRLHQSYILLWLTDVTDRNAAERFRDLYVMVPLADAVPLEDGEFYLYEVIGCEVETGEGEQIGVVTNVMETGANDVYVIDSPDYGEVLLPVTEETIIEHRIDEGRVRVNLIDGLLPDMPQQTQ